MMMITHEQQSQMLIVLPSLSYLSSTQGVTQSLMMARIETRNPTILRDMMLTRYVQYSSKSSQLPTSPSTDRKASRKFSVYRGESEAKMQVLLSSEVRNMQIMSKLGRGIWCGAPFLTTSGYKIIVT